MLRWWNELDSLKRGRQDQSHVTAAKKKPDPKSSRTKAKSKQITMKKSQNPN